MTSRDGQISSRISLLSPVGLLTELVEELEKQADPAHSEDWRICESEGGGDSGPGLPGPRVVGVPGPGLPGPRVVGVPGPGLPGPRVVGVPGPGLNGPRAVGVPGPGLNGLDIATPKRRNAEIRSYYS